MESPALGQQNGILENQTRMGGLESKCDVREAQKVLKMFELCLFYFLKDFIYLFLERGKERRKGGRETSVCGCFLNAPYQGPGLQPRHVP